MDIIDQFNFYSSHVCFTVYYIYLSDGVTDISVIKTAMFFPGRLPNLKTLMFNWRIFWANHTAQKAEDEQGSNMFSEFRGRKQMKSYEAPWVLKRCGLINLAPLTSGGLKL